VQDEDEEGSELDEDTLMDLGYAVSNPSTNDKPVTLNTRSPINKLPPTPRLDTPNVRHPLLPEAAPADGSATYGPPSSPLGQAESRSLYKSIDPYHIKHIESIDP